MSRFANEKQEALFRHLEEYEALIFAAGPPGISANIVGPFKLRRYAEETRLDMEDGRCHVHIDWARVRYVESGDFHGEGVLTFFDHDKILFRMYNPRGKFSVLVEQSLGHFFEDSARSTFAPAY